MVYQRKDALLLLFVSMGFILYCNAVCKKGTVHHFLETGQDVCCWPVEYCPAGHEIKYCSQNFPNDTCQTCPPGKEQRLNWTSSWAPKQCEPIQCAEGAYLVWRSGTLICECDTERNYYGQDPRKCIKAQIPCLEGFMLELNGNCTSFQSVPVNTTEDAVVAGSTHSSGSRGETSNALWYQFFLIIILPIGTLIFVLYKRRKSCGVARGNFDDLERGDTEMQPLMPGASLHQAALDGADEDLKNLLKISDDKGIKLCLDSRNEDGQTPLHLAAEGGHVTVMETLLDRGARVDIQDGMGRTPLHYVACSLKIEDELSESRNNEKTKGVLQLLVEKSDINCHDEKGITPLYLTTVSVVRQRKHGRIFIDRKRLNIAGILIQYGADVQLRGEDKDGDTFCHRLVDPDCGSVRTSDWDNIFEVLSEKQVDVNVRNIWGRTPLHVVFYRGEFDDERLDIVLAVYELLKCGADVTARDNMDETIFHYLARCQLPHSLKKYTSPEGQMIDSLLQRGRDLLNHKNKILGDSSLHSAVRYGNLYFVEKLLEFDCDVNIRNFDDETPLHKLAGDWNCKIDTGIEKHEDIKEIVKSLLKKSISIINSPYKSGDCPVHLAFRERKFNIADILIAYGCDVTVTNDQKDTILHVLVYSFPDGSKPTEETERKVESLVKKCTSVINTQNKYGDNPVHIARVRHLSWFVNILTRHECDATV